METITFTEAEIEFIIESFFFYSFAGVTAALLFYDFTMWVLGETARLVKSRFKAPQG
ncbi:MULTISPECIES: hypothetical protein [Vibrio]|uniref:hypothetical protein n=1 Tax=Vibrio TaxID=662 RepID=UPI002074DE2D|nr:MULTISPECIES: hypothetical protein [Vibrio]USD33954.1 hypothetical protein J8Z27_07675 [Vibrio sp. SCSIO 43186]USD44224.1 hypothetical protein J4N38_08060 [Vibrio sp. SCSIO 43145]USD71078.1 hypothetical protein J4N41_07680 [Vibrio sp. SCSIO 43139]